MARFATEVPYQAKLSYIALYSIRRSFTTSKVGTAPSQHHSSDWTGRPSTGSYEPGLPTSGPLGQASSVGPSRLTPRLLKQHLDQFVVGQERAKKKLCVAVYNHYQRVQELQRRDVEEEEEELFQQPAKANPRPQQHSVEGNPLRWTSSNRRRLTRFDADEFHGQPITGRRKEGLPVSPSMRFGPPTAPHRSHLTVEKSNMLLLGPSGVGKTLMAKYGCLDLWCARAPRSHLAYRTLARILEVPFSMSDCTPFTQAGYIGEDAEVCVQRLLSAANYDVARAEQGIICLDEVDKIATARVSHGKDVSGEGVQQALLKIVEGTTLQINSKQERGAGRPSNLAGYPSGSSAGGGPPSTPGGKTECFHVRTDNILFIFTGAFIGLPKIVMDRVSRGSLGFGQPVRASNSDGPLDSLKGEEHLYKKHLPFFTANSDGTLSPLDLVEPGDLQRFGLIPELVGRIPITTALSALDEEALVQVLTEPRNALLKQFEQVFQFSAVELRCTNGALREVARAALGMGTGARGLRTVMERLLGDAMYEAPGKLHSPSSPSMSNRSFKKA